MPHVNANGDIAHGVAGVGACLNNVQFDTGGDACWFNDDTIIYQHINGSEFLQYYDINTEAMTPASANGENFLFGSGNGHWAAWQSGVGLFSSVGFTDAAAGLLGIARDGAIAYRANYLTQGLRVRELSGADRWVSDGPATGVCMVNAESLIWTETQVLKTTGLPNVEVLAGSIYTPKALLVNGEWWVAYFCAGTGIVLHPADSVTGYNVVPTGDAWLDAVVLAGQPTVVRVAWSISEGEVAGHIFFMDIDTAVDARTDLGSSTTVPGSGAVGGGIGSEAIAAGTRILVSSGNFPVAGAAEEIVQLPIEIYPSFPVGGGFGRLVHPTLGAFDYEVKPDEWVNIDADAIIAPVWASSRTLTSAANVLWMGNLRDVVVEERWKALGGLAMPMTQLRMLLAIWTNPIDPDVGFVHWHPNYITGVSFKVILVNLSAGGQGVTFDDVVNYKDEFGEPIGWMTNPVTLQLKLVERL